MSYALLRTRPEIVGFLPNWAILLEINTYRIMTVCPDDTLVERAVIEVGDHNFEILRYDMEDFVLVYANNCPKPARMHKNKIEEYIRNYR